MTSHFESETTPLVNDGPSSSKTRRQAGGIWNVLYGLVVGVAFGGVASRMAAHPHHGGSPWSAEHAMSSTTSTPPKSRYTRVQGLGFQIYTGAAPAFLQHVDKSQNNSTRMYENPECINRHSYGHNAEESQLQCYIGYKDPIVDVERRIAIMRDAVERAHSVSDTSEDVLKIFVAPEFFWRGLHGAYIFADDEGDDDCGPICILLQGMEELVVDARFKDWLFLFGTVIASEVLPKEDAYDYLFYNFAPVYKGYDPSASSYHGKRFLVPKRYVSSSDFLTPERHMDKILTKELLAEELFQPDFTVLNPYDFHQKRYRNDMWVHYKQELTRLGYAMIEYDWVMVDEISMTIEICFDHDRRTALNTYLADIVTGSTTLIPSTTEERGLQYVPIPSYQAQISLVSSAGMTVVPDSLALTHNGTIFLQDGLSNDTGRMVLSTEECNKGGTEFEGGTEAVQRQAVLTPTDVFFEYKVRQDFARHSVYPRQDWKDELKGSFSAEMYEPLITVYEPVDIAEVMPS